MRTPLYFLIAVALCVSNVGAQQVGSIDLTAPSVASKASRMLLGGCKKLLGGTEGDGVVTAEDGVPYRITVELVGVESANISLGSEVTGAVRFTNNDTRPIKLPWSTDFASIKKAQTGGRVDWQQATFDFLLQDGEGDHLFLKSLTSPLFGSKLLPGTELAVNPGESVVARVRFALRDEFPVPHSALKTGDWQLSTVWSQADRSWSVTNCIVSSGYFEYAGGYYRQRNPNFAIRIVAKR